MRNALSIAFGAIVGSMYVAATNVPITAFRLIRPRLIVTGIISLKTRQTAGSRQSSATRSRPSRPRSHGIGSSTCTTVPITIDTA